MKHTNTLTIGRKIEKIRNLRGLSQSELGKLIGVTKQAISKMEHAEKIDDEKLKLIAEALGVSLCSIKRFRKEMLFHLATNRNNNLTDRNTVAIKKEHSNASIILIIRLFEELIRMEHGVINNR